MSAIRVAQASLAIVIFRKEERGERAVRRVFAKELVHRPQQALRLQTNLGFSTNNPGSAAVLPSYRCARLAPSGKELHLCP